MDDHYDIFPIQALHKLKLSILRFGPFWNLQFYKL